MTTRNIEKRYNSAREQYGELGVDCEKVMRKLAAVQVSMHCWQGDDVRGFENDSDIADGGIMATGNYMGRPRNPDELRSDIGKAYSMVPGRHRLNLHACYAEHGRRKVDRDEIDYSHFRNWTEWASGTGIGLDFNGTFFGHPMVREGLTLSSPDRRTRQFWIEHGKACRRIGARMGRVLKTPCVTNVWIPDGSKDVPADRLGPRMRLAESLDEIFSEKISPSLCRDAVESKLFGIGSESYVAGSHEFYLCYAIRNGIMPCFDTGHFHPTESIGDKISATLLFTDEILLHVSRGVRWDSDHVLLLSDDLLMIAREIVQGGFLGRVHIGLDYFDASINRVAAWVVGMRNMLKALLIAMLEPPAMLKKAESRGDLTARLVLSEEFKSLPFGAVWDYYCVKNNVAAGTAWLDELRKYEADVMSGRRQ